MKKTEISSEKDDDLLPEYDLHKLRLRKFGPGRKSFAGHGVVLAPDVAAVFPDSTAVNEALRFLMRVTRDSDATARIERAEPQQ
jgi:hypothetical protein